MSGEILDPSAEARRDLPGLRPGLEALDVTLNKVVVNVANRMQTDVGSLYLLEPNRDSLLLAATVGLLQSCVGNLRMQFSEGLVGLVAQQRAPVVLPHAPEHVRFKYFPEADEDEYQSFLGVPITDSDQLQGVLVVQTIEPRLFTADDCRELAREADLLGPMLRRHTV